MGEYYCWKTGILNNWGCFIGPGVSTDHCLDTFIIWTRPLNLTLICWTLELNLRFELWFALKLKLNLWFELWFAEKFEQDIWFELWFAIYFEPDLWFELWFAIKFELDLWFELWFVMKLKLDLWFELWFDWKFALCPALLRRRIPDGPLLVKVETWQLICRIIYNLSKARTMLMSKSI